MRQASAAPGHTAQRPPVWWAYLWWTATGALWSFGVVSLLTIGPLLLLIAGVLGLGGAVSQRLHNRSAIALVGGLATSPLYLAWLNREGPGTICEALQDGVTKCSERWSPWPFLAVGAMLLAVSILGIARTRRTG